MAVNNAIYEGQRRQVNDQYAATSSSNAYSRFLSQQRGERQSADATQGFKRGFPNFTAGFGQRGMSGGGVQSGVMQKAISDRVSDFGQNMGRMQQDQQQEMRQFDMSQANMDQWRTGALQDIETNKAADVANAALNINALKPYIGGY